MYRLYRYTGVAEGGGRRSDGTNTTRHEDAQITGEETSPSNKNHLHTPGVSLLMSGCLHRPGIPPPPPPPRTSSSKNTPRTQTHSRSRSHPCDNKPHRPATLHRNQRHRTEPRCWGSSQVCGIYFTRPSGREPRENIWKGRGGGLKKTRNVIGQTFCPSYSKIFHRHRRQLVTAPGLVSVGGSTLDLQSGDVPAAPERIQTCQVSDTAAL